MKKQFVSMSLAASLLSLVNGCGQTATEFSELASVPRAQLAGTWAKRMQSVSDSSALGVNSQSKIIRTNLVTLIPDGALMRVEEKACALRAENSGSSALAFPAAFLKGIGKRSYVYETSGEADVSALRLTQAVEIFGARLQDPLLDALPADSGDARLVDQDQDGKPGMTVDVSVKVLLTVKGSIYVSQRQVWSEELTVVDANRIQGRYIWSTEQNILGSSNALFTTVKPTVTPQLDQSSIDMVRLPEGADCDAAVVAKF